jgi:hypothetical protein
MPWQNDPAIGMMVPGRSGNSNREILQIDKGAGGANICNVLVKGRFDIEQATYLSIALSIAGDHEGTKNFVKLLTAATAGENGLRIGEYIQLNTGMVVPGSMPTNVDSLPRPSGDGHRQNILSRRKRPTQVEESE